MTTLEKLWLANHLKQYVEYKRGSSALSKMTAEERKAAARYVQMCDILNEKARDLQHGERVRYLWQNEILTGRVTCVDIDPLDFFAEDFVVVKILSDRGVSHSVIGLAVEKISDYHPEPTVRLNLTPAEVAVILALLSDQDERKEYEKIAWSTAGENAADDLMKKIALLAETQPFGAMLDVAITRIRPVGRLS